jgi:hypothetical protein
MSACLSVLEYAQRRHPELLTELEKTKKLPMAALSQLSGWSARPWSATADILWQYCLPIPTVLK